MTTCSVPNGNEIIRISSGIPGLDPMIEGGFPFPAVIMVAGTAGVGKTTFALKYLSEGARRGEQGLYFTTLSEPTQWMLRYASQFKFIDPEMFGDKIIYSDLGAMIRDIEPADLLNIMEEKIAEVMPQRIVIDPISVIGSMMRGNYRAFLFDMANRLKNWNATTVVTGEVLPGEMYPSDLGYAVDGIILLLMAEEEGARRKYLEVLKMRGTDHMTGKQSIDINRNDGIVVLKSRF
jgi:circadian clock protein KaiC